MSSSSSSSAGPTAPISIISSSKFIHEQGLFSMSGTDILTLARVLTVWEQQGKTASNDEAFNSTLILLTNVLKAVSQRTQPTLNEVKSLVHMQPSQLTELRVHLEAWKYTVRNAALPDPLRDVIRHYVARTENLAVAPSAVMVQQLRELEQLVLARTERPLDAYALGARFDCKMEHEAQAYRFPASQLQRMQKVTAITQLAARKHELASHIALERDAGREVADNLLNELDELQLHEYTDALRMQVYNSYPVLYYNSSSYRSQQLVSRDQRRRQKNRARQARNESEVLRKRRKAFLSCIMENQRQMVKRVNKKKKQLRKIANEAVRELQELSRATAYVEKDLVAERMRALKRNDIDEYRRLVKDAKNQRIEYLWKQTEEYMSQMNKDIAAHQSDTKPGDASAPEKKGVKEKETEEKAQLGETASLDSLQEQITEKIAEQPRMLQFGKLRSYQMAGLEWLVALYNNNLNGILADEMGLGKTVQSLSLIAHLIETKGNKGPFLIVVPMATLHNNWEYEFKRWLPDVNRVIYDGDKVRRKHIREHEMTAGTYNVLMTTYDYCMRDKKYLNKITWKYIIVDEAHRLKNPKCELVKQLATYTPSCRRVALTGTPLQNNLLELWALLNFIHPSIFNSVDNFEKWFTKPFQGMHIGDESDGAISEEEKLVILNRLHNVLRPFVLRREKSDVENELLDKIEQVVRCEMTQTQWLLYDQLLKSKLPFSNPSMQQRKITNHPYLFHPYMRNIAGAYQFPVDETLVQLSGKFSLLDRILPKLKRTGHRVLIFSTMTKVIDVLEMYFQLRNYKSLRFDGGTSSEVRLANVQKFNSDPDVFIMVLSTKAGGLGLNLQSADTVILFDSDWNPQNDMQAMARSHRIGQREQVIILRLITSATIEEKILSTAHEKIDKEAMVIQAGMFNNKYKFNQSRALMKKQLKHKMEEYDDDATSNDDITDILSRSDAERKLFEKMDAQWEREDKEGRSVLPADQMPAWVIHLCTKGKGSNTEQTLAQTEELVEFDRDILEIKEEASADAYIKVSGKRKSRNTDVKYMDADKELDKRVNSYANGRDSSSSEEEEEDTDGEGQVMMDVDEAPKAKSKKKGNGGANKRRKTASSA